MSRIKLHKEAGLNPTMLKYQCPVMGTVWESDEIALLGHNKGLIAERYSFAGIKICPEAKEKVEEGYVALIAIDESKSDIDNTSDTINTENAYRTGDFIWIKQELANYVFKDGIDLMAFVNQEVVDLLKNKLKELQDD